MNTDIIFINYINSEEIQMKSINFFIILISEAIIIMKSQIVNN